MRAAKVALAAWERRRAFGDLARAHTGIAAVYRSLHQLPPAGSSRQYCSPRHPPHPEPLFIELNSVSRERDARISVL